MDRIPDIRRIAQMFSIDGELLSAMPYGNGHINDTFLAEYRQGENELKYIHQRINHHVFRDPEALMENFVLLTGHLAGKLRENGAEDLDRRVLSPVASHSGKSYAYDHEGNLWRTTHYIGDTTTYDIVRYTYLAFEVGRCYGEFQTLLQDLSPDLLHATIPNFHNSRTRFDDFHRAICADKKNRAIHVGEEIAFAEARQSYVGRLEDLHAQGQIPMRIAHNDTKANNLLVDNESGRGLCVTDLDTTMPGFLLHDFGDMVRTATNSAAEDETVLDKVFMQVEIFRPLVNGYLGETGQFLNQVELSNLVFSCKLITFEIAIRFLTDYLQGDVYFKVHRNDHNLDRCRTQFKLLTSMEQQQELMEEIVIACSAAG